MNQKRDYSCLLRVSRSWPCRATRTRLSERIQRQTGAMASSSKTRRLTAMRRSPPGSSKAMSPCSARSSSNWGNSAWMLRSSSHQLAWDRWATLLSCIASPKTEGFECWPPSRRQQCVCIRVWRQGKWLRSRPRRPLWTEWIVGRWVRFRGHYWRRGLMRVSLSRTKSRMRLSSICMLMVGPCGVVLGLALMQSLLWSHWARRANAAILSLRRPEGWQALIAEALILSGLQEHDADVANAYNPRCYPCQPLLARLRLWEVLEQCYQAGRALFRPVSLRRLQNDMMTS